MSAGLSDANAPLSPLPLAGEGPGERVFYNERRPFRCERELFRFDLAFARRSGAAPVETPRHENDSLPPAMPDAFPQGVLYRIHHATGAGISGFPGLTDGFILIFDAPARPGPRSNTIGKVYIICVPFPMALPEPPA
jgi:hypothetical protein